WALLRRRRRARPRRRGPPRAAAGGARALRPLARAPVAPLLRAPRPEPVGEAHPPPPPPPPLTPSHPPAPTPRPPRPAAPRTTHFHAYATAYVIKKGQRFTVALAYVRKGDDLADVIKELLRQAAKAGVRPRYLLLDRGFYSVSVIRYLQAARCPFLMPVPCKGRQADHPKGPSGTRVFYLRKRGSWSRYTLTGSGGRHATGPICVKSRNYRGQR